MPNWVWKNSEWPKFKYDRGQFQQLEQEFSQKAGYLLGALQHLSTHDKHHLTVEISSDEAVETSAIEGEILNRNSVRASLCKNFGLINSAVKIPPSEQGIAFIMTDLYNNFAEPLSAETLCTWNLQITSYRFDLAAMGTYRSQDDPMQIISGSGNKTRVHYEAPPSNTIDTEMHRYIQWFNASQDLPPLIRAGIAHVYFELLHPFEDGNGRIGRALIEKSFSQSFGSPLLLSISKIIQQDKKEYYTALATCNANLDITSWLLYFADLALSAQDYSKRYVEFIIGKAKFYDRVKDQMNSRQAKVIARILREGLDGFKGGLSAENYIRITNTSRATATRDLQDLVTKKILGKTGAQKSTRYYLIME